MVDPDSPPCPPLRKITRVVETTKRYQARFMVFVACGHTLWRKESPTTGSVYCHKCIEDPREPILRSIKEVTYNPNRNQKSKFKVVLECGHIQWWTKEPIEESSYCRECRDTKTTENTG